MIMINQKIDELNDKLEKAEQKFGSATLNEQDWHIIFDRKTDCRMIEAQILVLTEMSMMITKMKDEVHTLKTA